MKKILNLTYLLLMTGLLLLLANACDKELSDSAKDNSLKTAHLNNNGQIVKDIDGNEYHTVQIGSQVWMVENLKVTHYRNGDPIPSTRGGGSGLYEDYNYDPNNSMTYGRLYTWNTVMDNRGIAPKGWHVPGEAEWQTLINYLGGESIAGSKMKESGTTHWLSPNTGATNESGFTALPGGYRSYNEPEDTFGGLGYYGSYWTTTSYSLGPCFHSMTCNSTAVGRGDEFMGMTLLSVRCIKDNPLKEKISIPGPVVKDIDGNKYTSVQIGKQIWMVENLKVTHFRNGDPIPLISDNSSWESTNASAYCWWNNDSSNKNDYGALYNGFTVSDSRNIAPEGWHIPSEAEWIALVVTLDPDSPYFPSRPFLSHIASNKLKEAGTTNWGSPNYGTNESGFTAIPVGFRYSDGLFSSGRFSCNWWSSTNTDLNHQMAFDVSTIRPWWIKTYGISIRCIRD